MSAASTALQQVLAREHRLSALMGWQLLLHQRHTARNNGLIAKELQSSPLADGELSEDLKSLLLLKPNDVRKYCPL